jgi:hypothetical protein
MSPASSCRRLATVVAAAVAAIAVTAGPALASGPAAGCPAAPVSNPFAPWGDGADYQLAPGGDVEDAGTSWTTTGGAGAAEGNETFMAGDPSDHLSMRVPAAGSAMTDRMCLGAEYPSFRFFVKRSGGSALSHLLVEVVVDDASGNGRALPVGLVAGTGAWAPTSSLPTVVNLLAPLHGNAIQASFRFKPVAGGTWSIDDVYVDPWRIH